MNRKILSLIMTLLLVFVFLSSCTFDLSGLTGGNGATTEKGDEEDEKEDEKEEEGEKEEEEEPDNLIYNTSSELYLIVDPDLVSANLNDFVSNLQSIRTEVVDYAAVDSEKHKHEIVIGNVDREISKTAMNRFERYEKNTDDEYVFAVYSDGSSIAVVWEEDDDGVVKEYALKYLCENYFKEELIVRAGVDLQAIDVLEDHYRKVDEEYKLEQWAKFEAKYGAELTTAYKQLYSIYSPDCIIWLANLYDPDICVCMDLYGEEECSKTKYCGTGGWYYSNSARDNYGYLPDAESTNQALGFLNSAGLSAQRGGGYLKIITEDMKKQIGDFIYALEEPNGYFYHPQWGKEFTDTKISRRARDLSWCEGILKTLNRTPKYTTASGVKGENPRQTSANLPGRLGSAVLATSKVILASGGTDVAYLQSMETFKAYLNSLDLRNKSYPVGNELTSTVPQIQERDRQIGTPDDPTPMMDYLIEWLNEGQNPETGNWDWKKPGDAGYQDYYGTNGLLKISGVYQKHKVVIPHAKEACITAMSDIINPAQIGAVVDLYNTWFAIQNVFENLRSCGGSEGEALVEEIQAELRKMAPEALAVSRTKISDFLKPDGSASYGRLYSSSTSQGCPAAVPNSIEGDVNGSTIAINGIIGHSAAALGVTRIPTFGEAERYLFIKTINNLSPVTKIDNAVATDPFSFDYDDTGAPSPDLTYNESNQGTGNVVADPTGCGKGNVIEMYSPSASVGDSIRVPTPGTSNTASCFVFEGDFCLTETNSNYPVQITLGSCYMLTFRCDVGTDGQIRLVGSSSASDKNSRDEYLGVTVNKNEWFRIKIEYYKGDAESVRIKFYADTDLTDDQGLKLYTVTDNYYDSNGAKITTGTSTPSSSFPNTNIFVLSTSMVHMYFDNVASYFTKQSYAPPVSDEGLYFNIDSRDNPEKKYDFEDGKLPADFNVDVEEGKEDTVRVEDGRLVMTGSDTASFVDIPLNVRTQGAKCTTVSFEVTYSEEAAVGKELLVLTGLDADYKMIRDVSSSVFAFAFKAASDSDGKYLSLVPRAGKAGDAIEGVRVPLGESLSILFKYYQNEATTLVYVKNAFGKYDFIGASDALFESGRKFIVDTVKLSTVEGTSSYIELDNMVVEKNADLFLDAVAPELPEKIYGFESQDSEVTLSGASVEYYGGDHAAELKNRGSSITVPVNKRSTLINSLVFRASLDFETLAKSGDTHTLSLHDSNGNTVFEFILSVLNGRIALYEVGKGGRLSTPIYTFDKNNIVLSFEVFNGAKMIHVKNGEGIIICKSSVFVGEEYLDNGYAEAKLTSLGTSSVLYVDDVKCESLYSLYKAVHISSSVKNPEKDYTSGLTFEESNSGSLPSSIYVNNNGNNYVSVENVKNEISGEYSNSLVLNKYSAGNDTLGFVSGIDTSTANSVVFEADIKIDSKESNEIFRFYFSANEKRQNALYMINVARSGDFITLADVSTDQSNPIKNQLGAKVSNGSWFKLRVELYRGDRNTVRFKVFVNGTLISVSDNFVGAHDNAKSPASLPGAVSIYCMGAMKATVCFDNVKIYTSENTCTDAVTTKK